jgi:molybdate transport system substrate-binding protein
MRRSLVALACAIVIVVGCRSATEATEATGATGPATTITIAAAADLRFALDDLIAAYRADHPDVDIVATYGSSGNAYSQIENGAPFDLYFSADIDYPRRLEAAGLAAAGATRRYAVGRIVVWVRNESPVDVAALGLDAIAAPSIETVAIANPEHAPYGRAAVAALRSADLHDGIERRFVLGENVAQALQFVESGAADIGIIAYSLALAPTVAGEGRFALIPADAHAPIEQGAVVLDRATDPAAATRFLDYVLGSESRPVLERYGFAVPEN